jgi:putative transposase
MKKAGFIEIQLVPIFKEVDISSKVGEACRKHGITKPTYYN